MSKPLILITNDDGEHAKGIEVLTRLMESVGDVVVVAPDGPRSGQSNAITSVVPIRFKKTAEKKGLMKYSCTGTPTDCAKLAINQILDRKPDLLVSGINHGSNAAINVIYSGTMGAVLEGCSNGIPSIGFSICDHDSNADFSFFEPFMLKIVLSVLKNGLKDGVCLNVNAPMGEIKGIRVARQTKGYWTKEFEKRDDPRGGVYYWMTGYFHNQEPEAKDSDEWLLSKGFISLVPTRVDMTDYHVIDILKKEFEE